MTRGARAFLVGLAVIVPALLLERLPAQRASGLATITVDYPEEGSLFPPEITAPTFLWRDAAETAAVWEIAVLFGDGSAEIHTRSPGERLRIGETDPRCVSATNAPPKLTARQAAAHTWKPDPETWAAIRKHSVERPAVVAITGLSQGSGTPVSQGRVSIQVSRDPVGAPIFYRDVPLMPSEVERGLIKPLSPFAVPLIGWRLRNIGEPGSRLVLEGLPTCANCHSFSSDGKTLGMDVDGPENDKGTYAIAPISPKMSIGTGDVITWNSFPGKTKGLNTLGFMAQLSPDGQYAVTTLNEQVYVANFKDYRFLQVFYPTRGILGWYSRATGQMEALPGADDPRYVQTNAVWSPDGKYLVFARAEARDAYPPGRTMAAYANDPNETPMQYDLYRIPFNAGQGGRPERIAGASRNGMSNAFPKVSPDGRWIVFVECRNGLLMRPDSRLYIVPSSGGTARLMRANTALMNSWHSFSPNGRWLVFSSKSRSPYTQMFLTHVDEEGRDSPPIFIENSTAANRAVNIPEFVNIAPDGLLNIDVPAADFYRLFDSVVELGEKGQWEAAVAGWRKVLEIEPENAKAHNNLAAALLQRGALDEAIAHFRKATQIKPGFDRAHFNLGIAFWQKGEVDEAIAHWRETVALNPDFAQAFHLLGVALDRRGKLDEAIACFRRALEIDLKLSEVHNDLGMALFKQRKLKEATQHFREAVALDPRFALAYYNLGRALAATGAAAEAAAQWRKALEIDPQYTEAAAALRGQGR
jgi:Flp pilus assembly protein TadD